MSPLREGSEEPGKRLGQLGFTSARRGAFILDSAWRALQIPDARPRLTAGHSGSHKCEFHGAQFIDAAIFCLRVFIGCDLVSGEQSARKARSEEHTSELKSLIRISYAVLCLIVNKE